MLAAFRLLPIMWQLTAIGVGLATLVAGAAYFHHKIYQSGYDAAIADVTHQNQEAVDAVNEGRARVRDCNARDGMRWDQVAGECVGRD